MDGKVWGHLKQQYGPSLNKEAKNALDLAPKLVEEWLTKYMFAGDATGPKNRKHHSVRLRRARGSGAV